MRHSGVSDITASGVVKTGVPVVEYKSVHSQSDCSERKRYAHWKGHAMTAAPNRGRSGDRRAALGWIAGQLAWENRLQTLRPAAPEPEDIAAKNIAEEGPAAEVDSAA